MVLRFTEFDRNCGKTCDFESERSTVGSVASDTVDICPFVRTSHDGMPLLNGKARGLFCPRLVFDARLPGHRPIPPKWPLVWFVNRNRQLQGCEKHKGIVPLESINRLFLCASRIVEIQLPSSVQVHKKKKPSTVQSKYQSGIHKIDRLSQWNNEAMEAPSALRRRGPRAVRVATAVVA